MRRLLLFLTLVANIAIAQKTNYLLAGTYTKGKSKGVYMYLFDEKTGSAKLYDSIETPNPSYLAVASNHHFYAVSETVRGNYSGKVRSFFLDLKTSRITYLNEQSSFGDNPCYVTVDKTNKWVFVGNYTSGTLASLPIEKDGSLGPVVSAITHTGHSVNQQRQTSPHVHSVIISPDNKFLFVPDLGIDKIMVYAFDDKTGKLTPAKDSAVKLEDGSGPRHFDFHPNGKWAYLIQEMAGTVTTFDYKNGKLTFKQTISCIPPNYNQYFTSADIHVSKDGKFVYASTRDSLNIITIFKVDQANGRLIKVGEQSTLGKTPRNFNFDPSGNFLLVANQNSDSIVIFKIDRQTGLLTDTGNRIDVGNPVCIKWLR